MKRLLSVFLILSFLCLLPSCTQQKESRRSFYLMDTVITVTLYADDTSAQPVFDECRRILTELDALWSRTKEGSDTARFNHSESGIEDLDPRTVTLIQKAELVSNSTDGAFDITVLPLVELWSACEADGRLPTKEELAAAQKKVSYQNLQIHTSTSVQKKPGTAIDLGGIGKGAAMSAVIAYLEETDIMGGVVSFGSNVAVFGKKPDGSDFRIALRDPKDPNKHADVIVLRPGEILSVSGDYERFYTIDGKRYHHILDPQTGYPSDSGLSSVAVITTDGAMADALSTAIMILGEVGMRSLQASGEFDFEAICIKANGELISDHK